MNLAVLYVALVAALISQASSQCYRVGLFKASCNNIPDAGFNFSLIPGPQGPHGNDSILCESGSCNSYKRELKTLTADFETFAINIKKLVKQNQELKLNIKTFENFQRKLTLKNSLEIARSAREVENTENQVIWVPPVNKRERIWKTLRWSNTKNTKNKIKRGKKGKKGKRGKKLKRRRKLFRKKLKRNRRNGKKN